MILYNITINIDHAVAEEWLEWMQQKHIPDVMATGYFLRNQVCRMLNEEDNGGVTYAVQYFARNMEDLEEFLQDHAPALQDEYHQRYQGRYVSFRSMLEVVSNLPV
jgi:hypothetical protein